jgi:hypothetical protein
MVGMQTMTLRKSRLKAQLRKEAEIEGKTRANQAILNLMKLYLEGKKHHLLIASQDHTRIPWKENNTSPTESYGRKAARHIRGKHSRAGENGKERLQQEPGA